MRCILRQVRMPVHKKVTRVYYPQIRMTLGLLLQRFLLCLLHAKNLHLKQATRIDDLTYF